MFGALFTRFIILFVASELWLTERMRYFSKAAIILQKIVVESRTRHYQGNSSVGYSAMFSELYDETDIVIVPPSENCSAWGINQDAVADDTKSESLHRQLTQSFVEFQWE